MSDLEAVPNPVVHSCQVLDPGRDVRRIRIVSEELKRGRQMGYSRSVIVDADQPRRVLALTEGQGISIGTPPEGLQKMTANPIEVIDSPDLPPLWQVFGGQRRSDGRWALPELATEVASPDAALHIGPQFVILETAAADPGCRDQRHHRDSGRVVPRDVSGPRQGRALPRRGGIRRRRRRAGRRQDRPSRRGCRGQVRHRRVVPVPPRRAAMTSMPAPLLLLDGASMWFRSYFGVPSSITAPDGRPVNALRGFLDTVATLITRERPARLVVCRDDDWRPQWRVDLIPSYKAHRVAEPEPGRSARHRGGPRRPHPADRHDHGDA